MTDELESTVRQLIDDAVADRPIVVSVSLVGSHGVALSVRDRLPHYAASTMKLAVLLAAYRERDAGRLDLDTEVGVHEEFRSRTGELFSLDREDDDADPEPWQRLGGTANLSWLCRRMIIRSSNLATDLVCEQLGFAPVEEAIRAVQAPGLRVQRMIGDYSAQPAGWSNQVTAAGLNTMLLALQNGTAAAPSTCAELLAVLAANEIDTDVRGGLPPGTWVAHTNGWVSDAVHDAALVRPDDAPPFALTVASSGPWGGADGSGTLSDGSDGHALIRRIAAAVWEARHRI